MLPAGQTYLLPCLSLVTQYATHPLQCATPGSAHPWPHSPASGVPAAPAASAQPAPSPHSYDGTLSQHNDGAGVLPPAVEIRLKITTPYKKYRGYKEEEEGTKTPGPQQQS